jgi:hypothetical protein
MRSTPGSYAVASCLRIGRISHGGADDTVWDGAKMMTPNLAAILVYIAVLILLLTL